MSSDDPPNDGRLGANPPANIGHKESRIAGLFVTSLSAIFVFGLIILLFHHTNSIRPLAQGAYLTPDTFEVCESFECLELMVEREIQRFRAMRVETALLYRNEVQMATLIVSLAMTVLGAVLIFDRVRGDGSDRMLGERGKMKIFIVTTFPGVLLCFLGTAALIFNIYAMTSGEIPIMVTDHPVLRQVVQDVTAEPLNPEPLKQE